MKKQILNISKAICKNNNLELNPENLSALITYQLLQDPFYADKYNFLKLGMDEKSNVFLYNNRYQGELLENLSISQKKINFGKKNEDLSNDNIQHKFFFDLLNESERDMLKSFLFFLKKTNNFENILSYFESRKSDLKKIICLLNPVWGHRSNDFHLLTISDDIIYNDKDFSLNKINKNKIKEKESIQILNFSKKIQYVNNWDNVLVKYMIKSFDNDDFYQLISLGNKDKLFRPANFILEDKKERFLLFKKIIKNRFLYDNSFIKTLLKKGGLLKNIYNDFFFNDQKIKLIKKIKDKLLTPNYEFYFEKYNEYVKLGVEKILEKRHDFNHFKIERLNKKEGFLSHLNKELMTLNLFDDMNIELKLSGFEGFNDYKAYNDEDLIYFYAHNGKEVLGILKLEKDELFNEKDKKGFVLVVVDFNKKCNDDEEITKELLHQAYSYVEKEKAYLHIDFARDKVMFLRSVSDEIIDNYNIVYDFKSNIGANVRELLEIEIRNKIIDKSLIENVNYDETFKEMNKVINFLNKHDIDETIPKYDKKILSSMAEGLINEFYNSKNINKMKIQN